MENEVSRWTLTKDMNSDGVFTSSDATLWREWLYFLPGDLAIVGLLVWLPELAVFLEISPASIGELGSLVFSGVFWFLSMLMLLILLRFADDYW